LPINNADFGSSNNLKFLGNFGDNESTTLSLSGLKVGATYYVSFDLFIGRSWDDNSRAFGPDRWMLTADGTALVDTTFVILYQNDGSLYDFTQNYSDLTPVGAGSFAAYASADVAQTAGGIFDR